MCEQCDKYKAALQNIVSGGDWLIALYKEQDVTFPRMPLAYAKDVYRISKKALMEAK